VVCARCGMKSAANLVCGYCGATQPEMPRMEASPEEVATKAWVRGYAAAVAALVLIAPLLVRGCAHLADVEGRARRDQEERDRRALEGR
jgi:hypothetical protein